MIGIMKGIHSRQSDQRGMASFMVTTVLILVIALIIIGFSQVARRNQRETLDRQLSTQAFYAAESGVNGAISVIRNSIAGGSLPPEKSRCEPDDKYSQSAQIDGQNVEITCLLVSSQINSLYYMGITENSPTVVPVVSATGAPISQITLTWRTKSGVANPSQNCNGNGRFTSKSSWSCGHGLLRTDLSNLPDGDPGRIAMTTFFDPYQPYQRSSVTEGTAPVVTYDSGGGMVRGYCSDAGGDPKCMAKITGLNASTYYMTLRSLYHESTVTVTAQDVNGLSVNLIGQALIDVTARAQDVIRRIQVRVPLEARESSGLPGYAIESTGSICKRFAVEPGFYDNDTAVNCN